MLQQFQHRLKRSNQFVSRAMRGKQLEKADRFPRQKRIADESDFIRDGKDVFRDFLVFIFRPGTLVYFQQQFGKG